MLEISESKRLAKNYDTPLNSEKYSEILDGEVNEKIDLIKSKGGDLHFENIFIASLLFSFKLLLIRDWTIFWRNPMKFGSVVLNTIMRFLLVGFLFMHMIPSR